MPHPLDPATADELSGAVTALRSAERTSERTFFGAAWALEPSRDAVAAFDAGESVARVIRLVGHDREQGQSFEADVTDAVRQKSCATQQMKSSASAQPWLIDVCQM